VSQCHSVLLEPSDLTQVPPAVSSVVVVLSRCRRHHRRRLLALLWSSQSLRPRFTNAVRCIAWRVRASVTRGLRVWRCA